MRRCIHVKIYIAVVILLNKKTAAFSHLLYIAEIFFPYRKPFDKIHTVQEPEIPSSLRALECNSKFVVVASSKWVFKAAPRGSYRSRCLFPT